MTQWLTFALIVVGSVFSLLGAVGIFRMPDLYTRIQAAAKSSTLGVSCLVLATAVHFGGTGTATRAVLVIAFLFLTVPVAAHMIGRAAYAGGVPLWERSVIDELQSHADGGVTGQRGSETDAAGPSEPESSR